MRRAEQIDALAGALRVLALELEPTERSSDFYAAHELDLALEHLTSAARALREVEVLRIATSFAGGES